MIMAQGYSFTNFRLIYIYIKLYSVPFAQWIKPKIQILLLRTLG